MEYQKYAVIDIGSNSLRLMTGWQEVPGTWTFSPKELATTQSGRASTKHATCRLTEWKRLLLPWKAGRRNFPAYRSVPWLLVPFVKPLTARPFWPKCGPVSAGTVGLFQP